ncbi:MAG: helix-turn-helix transcriptional regulator [Pseudomonadota bacterium]
MASNRNWGARNRDKPVLVSEIERLSAESGYESAWQSDLSPESVIMGGEFALQQYSDGLRVHVTSGVESSDLTAKFTVGPALTIFILLEGYVAFTIEDAIWELGADDGVNVETGLIWSRTRDTVVERHMRRGRHVCKVGITLEPVWFEKLDLPLPSALMQFRERHLAQVQWCPSPGALRNAHDIIRPIETAPLQARLATQQKALQIVQEAFGLFDEEAVAEPNGTLAARAPEIRDFLDDNLDLDLSLEQIGRSLGMSVTVLQERFRDAFGMTIGEYRRQQRLIRAMLAIRDEGTTVTDAALVAGYSSPANFATAFSRHFGYPPSQVRR